MDLGIKYQGRVATSHDVEFIKNVIAENPRDGRRSLSPKICKAWNGRMIKLLTSAWESFYNHPVYFVETVVDTERFKVTCYKSVNWIYLGETTGRGKNAQTHKPNRSIKAVWGYPLSKTFRRLLQHV